MISGDLPTAAHSRITAFHISVIALSLMMTFGAWEFSKHQIQTRTQARFESSRDQALGLIQDRMTKYEDALWAGVSTMESHGGDMSYEAWRSFAETLRIEEKYPGINGIGVIHFLSEQELGGYLAVRRAERPSFRIFPEHNEGLYMPISFIEPEGMNQAAVGLDVAHERNRRLAALASSEEGTAQITGPIVLVQDAGHTAGFLFYAPFGSAEPASGDLDGSENARGAVYAPFVVRKLMEGLLAKELRDVRFSIQDDGELIFDEHDPKDPLFDADPMFSETVTINLYGRDWVLDVRTNQTFRESNTYAQPTLILIGGLLIEALIISMLILMARANGRAIGYANKVTVSLREKSDNLLKANDDLDRAKRELKVQNEALCDQNAQIEEKGRKLKLAWEESEALRFEQADFTYSVSHDLKSPANTMQLLLNELSLSHAEALDQDGRDLLGMALKTSTRMAELIEDVLLYAWATEEGAQADLVDMRACVDDVLADMACDIANADAQIEVGALDPVYGYKTQLRMLIQNLVANAIKFHNPDIAPKVSISCKNLTGAHGVVLTVEDNGIGIAPENHTRIFGLFQRLHVRETYPGTGLGLTTCQRIALNHSGEISVMSELGQGSTFKVLLRAPKQRKRAQIEQAAA